MQSHLEEAADYLRPLRLDFVGMPCLDDSRINQRMTRLSKTFCKRSVRHADNLSGKTRSSVWVFKSLRRPRSCRVPLKLSYRLDCGLQIGCAQLRIHWQ